MYNYHAGLLLLELSTAKQVHEGDVDIPINCPLAANHQIYEYTQIWKINNSLYDLLYLPSLFVPNVPFGISIKIVERSMTQVSYQCFIPVEDGNGINVETGELDTLTVIEKGKSLAHCVYFLYYITVFCTDL